MTYDRSKVTELIKTSGQKLQALIKEERINVQLIVKSSEKVKKNVISKDMMKQNKEKKKTILKDNVFDSVSEVFSICVLWLFWFTSPDSFTPHGAHVAIWPPPQKKRVGKKHFDLMKTMTSKVTMQQSALKETTWVNFGSIYSIMPPFVTACKTSWRVQIS